jgi:hypothetical protein
MDNPITITRPKRLAVSNPHASFWNLIKLPSALLFLCAASVPGVVGSVVGGIVGVGIGVHAPVKSQPLVAGVTVVIGTKLYLAIVVEVAIQRF